MEGLYAISGGVYVVTLHVKTVLSCFQICVSVHVVSVSGCVATHLHFPIGPVWFHTGECINKIHVGAVISFMSQK